MEKTFATVAHVRNLKNKVLSEHKTLQVYETTLISQALHAYEASQLGYEIHKTSFRDLLDSKRLQYRVQTEFYHSLQRFVFHITLLESHLGFSVSDLVF